MRSPSPDVVDDFLRGHSSIPDEGTFSTGTAFGDWRITAFVAKGGNGEVYRVQNRISGQAAALKVLVAASDPVKRERFLREVKLLERLKGSHFPRLFATGELDGFPYFVIEFLEPVELPKTDRAIARYLLEVCEAVGMVHRLGYIHRDLKPQNILRREDGTLVLIDYGLVKPIMPESTPREDSLSIVDGRPVGVGTPKYAAPEQFAGGEISPATDIHALGVLAENLLGDQTCLHKWRSGILSASSWRQIIRRATSSIVSERYQSVDDFAAAIRSRNRGTWMLRIGLLSAILALSAIGGWIWWVNGGEEQYRWARLCDIVVTNRVEQVLVREIMHVRTNSTFGVIQDDKAGVLRLGTKDYVTQEPERHFEARAKEVRVTMLRLNNGKFKFEKPIRIGPGEYWIEGPGVLDAVLQGPTGTIVRLHRCIVTNRTEVAYPQNGIRYELEHLADLSLPNLSDENWRRYIEPFDGAYNRVKFGKGARFEMSEQDMLNLDR